MSKTYWYTPDYEHTQILTTYTETNGQTEDLIGTARQPWNLEERGWNTSKQAETLLITNTLGHEQREWTDEHKETWTKTKGQTEDLLKWDSKVAGKIPDRPQSFQLHRLQISGALKKVRTGTVRMTSRPIRRYINYTSSIYCSFLCLELFISATT